MTAYFYQRRANRGPKTLKIHENFTQNRGKMHLTAKSTRKTIAGWNKEKNQWNNHALNKKLATKPHENHLNAPYTTKILNLHYHCQQNGPKKHIILQKSTYNWEKWRMGGRKGRTNQENGEILLIPPRTVHWKLQTVATPSQQHKDSSSMPKVRSLPTPCLQRWIKITPIKNSPLPPLPPLHKFSFSKCMSAWNQRVRERQHKVSSHIITKQQ